MSQDFDPDLAPSGVPNPFATLGLTFDDVLLQPNESDVIPSQVDTRAQVSRNISIKIPLLSSPMDTVTEARMAIAIAREGGLGVIHRNMPLEDQARMVDQVKRSEAGMIDEPITISPDATLREADELCGHFRISGIPVVDEEGHLLGIVTNRDMRFETDGDRKVGAVMTKMPLVTGRFDDQQLFYLRSRGIDEAEARRLVVHGFFADIIGKIGVPEVEKPLMEAVEKELAINIGTPQSYSASVEELHELAADPNSGSRH